MMSDKNAFPLSYNSSLGSGARSGADLQSFSPSTHASCQHVAARCSTYTTRAGSLAALGADTPHSRIEEGARRQTALPVNETKMHPHC
jgi:hypothetical protein